MFLERKEIVFITKNKLNKILEKYKRNFCFKNLRDFTYIIYYATYNKNHLKSSIRKFQMIYIFAYKIQAKCSLY